MFCDLFCEEAFKLDFIMTNRKVAKNVRIVLVKNVNVKVYEIISKLIFLFMPTK